MVRLQKLNKQFTGKDKDKARELYDTIIFDTVDIASMSEICSKCTW